MSPASALAADWPSARTAVGDVVLAHVSSDIDCVAALIGRSRPGLTLASHPDPSRMSVPGFAALTRRMADDLRPRLVPSHPGWSANSTWASCRCSPTTP